MSDWIAKIRLAAGLAKVVLTERQSKMLEKLDGGLEIAEKVRELIPPKKKQKKR